MVLAEICRRKITYCLPQDTIEEVAQIMKDDDVGAVLVVTEGMPCGIITDRDITIRCVAYGMAAKEERADSIMSRGVETVRQDEGIYIAAQKMKKAQVRRLAVVDLSGNAVGLVSFDDVFDLLSDELGSLREVVHFRKKNSVFRAA